VEVFGGVAGWVEVFGVFGLVPIGDFDIFRAFATRREMLRNVEKCRKMLKNVEFCRSRYWGGASTKTRDVQIIQRLYGLYEAFAPFSVSHLFKLFEVAT
jgi:hypothetical protein